MTNPFFLVMALGNFGAAIWYLKGHNTLMGLSLLAYVAGSLLQAFGTIK